GANWLGAALRSRGFVLAPGPAASVVLRLGAPEIARRMTAAIQEAGIVVHLDEPEPGEDRPLNWVFHVMAAHRPADLSAAVQGAIAARNRAGDPTWTPAALCGA
ncbi:hypothetical protein HKCCE3408_14965, partial [Rhodobacterales bacterium HKCCE3408]|nr:hypothetical protein [Rhodobacterales bacterium HKCCE3408]